MAATLPTKDLIQAGKLREINSFRSRKGFSPLVLHSIKGIRPDDAGDPMYKCDIGDEVISASAMTGKNPSTVF